MAKIWISVYEGKLAFYVVKWIHEPNEQPRICDVLDKRFRYKSDAIEFAKIKAITSNIPYKD